jgi:hypothetical protein
MHSAIVVIKIPELLHTEAQSQRWANYVGEVDDLIKGKQEPLGQQTGVARLGENVWLVNVQQNPAAVARLVYFATQYRLDYGILPLDGAPQWLPVGADPRTN